MSTSRLAFAALLTLGLAAPGAASASDERVCSLEGTLTEAAAGDDDPDPILISGEYTVRDGSIRLSGSFVRTYVIRGRMVERNGRPIEDIGSVEGAQSGGTWTLELRYQEGATGTDAVMHVTGTGALDGNKLNIRGTYEVVEGNGGDGTFRLRGKCPKV